MVLAISAPALADDLNPPVWSLGPGTIYAIWGFPSKVGSGQVGDFPEEGAMVPHATHPDPEEETGTSDPDEIAHQHMVIDWAPDSDNWLASHEGREGVVSGGLNFSAYNFPGEGSKIIRLQLTWTGTETGTFWFAADGMPEWSQSASSARIETVDLGGGWSHSTYEFLIEANPGWEGFYIGDAPGDIYIDQVVVDTICYPGDEPPTGPCGRCVEPAPILIDPNVMMVYETDETEGDFGVYLRNQPPSGATITVTVDPNGDDDGPNEDVTLIGGDPCEGGTITMTFNNGNWDVPQIIAFKAIDDLIAEPPVLVERSEILVSSSWPGHESDANYVGEKIVAVEVMDNDQANILFRVTPARGGTRVAVTGPVQLWEEYTASDLLRWRKIGFQLQVQPSGDPVKLNAEVTGEIEGDNLPPTDPCLPLQEADDPNCFTFTSTTSTNGLGSGCADHDVANKTTCWNVDQNIKIWGNDDAVLQVMGDYGEYPTVDGDQNYQAVLEVTVIDDGGDERYADLAEDDPKTVDIDIQDNECGAFGVLPLDVGNPNAFTDPNYRDSEGNPLPDCYVDIYDVIELATKWLDCSDIHYPYCESYL